VYNAIVKSQWINPTHIIYSIYIYIHLFVYLSIYLSIYLFIYVCIYLLIYIIYIFLYLYTASFSQIWTSQRRLTIEKTAIAPNLTKFQLVITGIGADLIHIHS